ncbi:hypothetical protein GCM10010232_68120 [Streptomyces amakusaensis]|uniref:NPCBM/NEW2 domain-containing protein n=1 Tax=Streptomyces amakusaensis TaxID=67271 RepID=A0ABW0AT66_9ACTN
MAQHGQEGDGLPAREEEGDLSREEKDRLKAEFGRRLRALLDLTGLSSREFAQRYPAYKDSTIRKYTLGANLPPWDFLRDLLTEVSRRTEDPAGEQRAAGVFDAYRLVLVRTGAHIRGSDQNSLLLRLYDGETALHRVGQELAEVREREEQLRARLEELRESEAVGPPAASELRSRLEKEAEELVRHRAGLVQRRADLIGDLDRSRAHLLLLEAVGDRQDQVPAVGSSVHPRPVPPIPSTPPSLPAASGSRSRRTRWILITVLAASLTLATGAALGVWATQRNNPEPPTSAAGGVTSSPTPTPPPSSPTPSVSSSSGSPSPSPAPPDSSPSPSAPPKDTGARMSLVRDFAPLEDGGYLTEPLRVNTRIYRNTLTHQYTESTWQLDRKYTSLVARVGVDDSTESGGGGSFYIKVDGIQKAELTRGPGDGIGTMRVDLRGAFRVTLGINVGSSGRSGWIDPVITKEPARKPD